LSCSEGFLPTKCIKCEANLFTVNDTITKVTSCVTTCPLIGFYPNTTVLVCEKCMEICSSCENGESCLECSAGYFLFEGGLCVTNCPIARYFDDNVTHRCIECDPTCYNCNGSLKFNCTNCMGGLYLRLDIGTCEDSCPKF